MPSRNRSIGMLIVSLALVGCDSAPRPAATQPATPNSTAHQRADEPREIAGGEVVFSRNLERLGDEYDILPGQYRLGTAYVRRPPQWWKDLAEERKLEPQATSFPLVFVGRWKPEGGVDRLLVLQMRHRFNGDGYYTPGPALWLAAYVFEQTPSGKWSLLNSSENALNLHSMQNARFLAGRWEQRPTSIALQIDQKDGQGNMNPTNITGTISPDGKINFSQAGNY